jgi:uncharacterized coiled-coil DUF342 family protein
MGKLRIEERTVTVAAVTGLAPVSKVMPAQVLRETTIPSQDVEHWRKLAIQSGQQLQNVQKQCTDLGKTADELRARLTKANERRENAQARANELHSQLIAVTAERDALRAELAPKKDVVRTVYDVLEEAQQSLLARTI